MKKSISLAIAAIFIASAIPAKAEILKNLKTNGEVSILGVMSKNVTDAQESNADHYRNTYTRLTYGMAFDLLDELHANLSFKKDDHRWGDHNAGNVGQDITSLETAITIEESNIVMDKLFDKFSAKIGRQYYGDEGDINVY